MKILFNTYTMAFQRPGGGEQILYKTYQELKARGVEVELFDPWSTKIEEFDIVHHFSLLEWQKFKDYKVLGTKVVVTPTTWPRVDFKTLTKDKLRNAFFKTLNPKREVESLTHYQNYVDLFFPTTKMEQSLIEKRYQIPPQKCRVIHNGVIPPQRIALEDNQFFKEHRIEDPILFSGSIRTNKNIHLLIEACIKNKWPLIIMGKASGGNENYEKKCRDLAKNAASPILWVGHIKHGSQTYNEIYSLARCICIPSNFETFCLAAAEAGAIGKPIIVPFEGATTEVYGSHATYLKEYSIDGVSNAIKEALNRNQESTDHLEEHIRKIYSWDNIINHLISHYQKLCD